MTAPAGRGEAGDNQLRSALVAVILDRWRILLGGETYLEASEQFADAVLALPELADLIRAREQVAKVAAIHVPYHGHCVVCDDGRDTEAIGNNPDCPHHTSFCASCDLRWPCPTARALSGGDITGGER